MTDIHLPVIFFVMITITTREQRGEREVRENTRNTRVAKQFFAQRCALFD